MAPPRKPLTGPDDPRHGTPHGYHLCRPSCDPCRAAWRTYVNQRIRIRKQLLAEGVEVTHGTKATYDNWGCRCRPCTDAVSAYSRDYQAWRREQARAGAS